MDIKSLGAVVSMLFLIGVLSAPHRATAREHRSDVVVADGGVLTGELVPIRGTSSRFRIVGHAGTFTAPSSSVVEEFDGKAVEVQLSRDGHVLQITQLPIHTEPINHGYEVVSGELVTSDPVGRTFGIAGDNRLFSAPPSFDVRAYAGRMVVVHIDEHGAVTNIDTGVRAADAPPIVEPLRNCSFNDVSVTNGSSICQAGTMYRCANGEWLNSGIGC